MELLNTLYRDDALIAIDKPSGLLVHRSRISRDHIAAVQLLRDQIGRFVYPVHRLDRPTSGVLVFALDPETASLLKSLWDEGKVTKTYLAVVRGWTEPQGLVDWALRADEGDVAKEARTSYRRLATGELLDTPVSPHLSARCSLIEAVPHTGRMHQIRKHMKHLSHPVIGDTTHGDKRYNQIFEDRFEVRRLLLFAQTLALPHPHTGAPLNIRAELPAVFRRVYNAFGWNTGD